MPDDDALQTTLLELYRFGVDYWKMSLESKEAQKWFVSLEPAFFPMDNLSLLFQQR